MPENGIRHNGLKLKKKYYEPSAEAEDNLLKNQAETESSPALPPARGSPTRNAPQRLRQNIILTAGWLLFLLLGGGLIYIRFFLNAPGLTPDLLKQYGMIAVGVAYLVAVGLAIKDNMFDGLLAIVVPFYPFYYLFLKRGSVLLSAFAGALLVAFGFDCLLFLQNIASKIINRVAYLIQNA